MTTGSGCTRGRWPRPTWTSPQSLSGAHLPLYSRPDKAELLKAMSGFGVPTVDVSSGADDGSDEEGS